MKALNTEALEKYAALVVIKNLNFIKKSLVFG